MAAAASAAPLGATRAQAPNQDACPHLFSKMLEWLGYHGAAEVAAAAEFGGLDWTVRPKGHVEPAYVERDLPRAVEAARKQGLRSDMIVTEITSAEDTGAETLLKTAAQCGVKVYRMGYLRYDDKLGVDGTLRKLNRQMAGLAELNRKCGIIGCYQNHYAWNEKLLGGAVWDICHMLQGLDPAWIGCQYDVRHAVADSFGSWVAGMRRVAPFIRSTCLKDFDWEKIKERWRPGNVFAGEGAVPWDRYFKLVRELKIGGPASVHCEWDLFTKEEQERPEAERRKLAAERLKRDGAFFAAQYLKYGLTAR